MNKEFEEKIRLEIEKCNSIDDYSTAISLDEMHERLVELTTLTECYFRDTILKLPKLKKQQDCPEWLLNIKPESNFQAFDNLIKIIECIPCELPEFSLSFENDSIEVHWDNPSSLTWVIYKPKFRFPAVNVRVYSRIDEFKPAMNARTIFLAQRLIKNFEQCQL